MKELGHVIRRFLRGADLVLLGFCLAACVMGLVLISSATKTTGDGSGRFLTIQISAIIIGVIFYILMTYLDLEDFSRHWKIIFALSILIILLLIPFGKTSGGNRSWISISGFPVDFHIGELIKIPFIILMAKLMYTRRDKINHVWSMAQMLGLLFLFLGIYIVVSDDVGVALTYVFIFFIMAIASNIKFRWFAAFAVALGVAIPILWEFILKDFHKQRIITTFNPEIDPLGSGYQAIQSKIALGAGQLTGQGLGNGMQTQNNHLPAKYTDFIFSVAGEELGFIGCTVIIVILVLIILRCLQISLRAKSSMSMLICVGVAGMLIYQVFENIGMCAGVMPIIGITLPFISYGGSSIVTLFIAMGLVSSVKMHPMPSWLKDRN